MNRRKWLEIVPLVATVPLGGLAAAFLLYHPALPDWGDRIAAGLFLGFIAYLVGRKSPYALRATLAATLLVLFSGVFVTPKKEADWIPEHARTPVVSRDGTKVHIENIRDFRYRTESEYEEIWHAWEFDLAEGSGTEIRSVDYVVVPFIAGFRGAAHAALSFELADGRRLAFSLEIKREKGEEYSPIGGLFENYETTIVLGTEIDVLGVRSLVWELPVYLYPTNATPEQATQLFELVMSEVNRIREEPEFYNTLWNNCSTPIIRAVAALLDQPIPLRVQTVLPGYTDEFAHEAGWIAWSGDIESARQRFQIAAVPIVDASPIEWSRAIREGRESR